MSYISRSFDGTILPDIETLTGNVGGAVGPDGAFNITIVGTGGVTVTGTPLTNTLSISDTGVDQSNILYVGKHGNDANDGLSIEKAKLTFGNALAAAAANTVIWCFDDGQYTENLTGATNVDIFAPNAALTGAHTMANPSDWTFASYVVATGTTGITFNAGGGECYIRSRYMQIDGTGVGIDCINGEMFVDILYIVVQNGNIVGGGTSDKVRFNFNSIDISGTATAFECVDGGIISIRGDSVENSGAGNGELFETSGGGAPEIHATITYLDLERLSDITAGSICNLNAARLWGSLAEAGAGSVTVGGATRIDNIPIGVMIPSNGAFTTLSATTPITVPSGGTGVGTLTDHGVLVGSGVGIITAAAVGGTGELLVGAVGADPVFGTSATGDFTFTSTTASQTRVLTVSNTDNTGAATSAANVQVTVGGANVGDPQTTYTVTGGSSWSTGIDNSATDAYKISQGTVLGGVNDTFLMSTAGERTMPLQPSFKAYNSATDTQETGDNTAYTVEFDTEAFDQGGDYDNATDIFTAPVTGIFYFTGAIMYEDLGAAHTRGTVQLITTATTYTIFDNNIGAMRSSNNDAIIQFSVITPMTAADTVFVRTTVYNSTKTVDIWGTASASDNRTFFSGYLVC